MAEPTATPDPVVTPATTPAAEPTISGADVRKHKAFLNVTDQLATKNDELAALKASIAKAEEDRKRETLEAAGNWKQIEADMVIKHEAETAKIEAELVGERLTNKLVLAGVTHPFAIQAALQQYTPGDQSLDDYVTAFAATDEVKALLTPAAAAAALPGGNASAAAARSTDNSWAETLADKQSGDAVRMMSAAQKYKAFIIAHPGEKPPGWPTTG